jgi:alcohol dehydrogenase (cytochrome c)
VVTGSYLVFTGDPEGNFFALDGNTGEKLWSFATGSGHRGSPISYAVNGRQYVAVPVGWGSALSGLLPQLWPETEDFPGGDTLFVFALPAIASRDLPSRAAAVTQTSVCSLCGPESQ